MKKTRFYLTAEERRFILHSLNALKTKLHNAGQYTDTVAALDLSVVARHVV